MSNDSKPIHPINAFKTSDGSIFESRSDALDHQKQLNFAAWYEDNTLLGNHAHSRVDTNDLIGWLKENRNEVLDFLR